MKKLIEYEDLLADVRWNGRLNSIRNLVQPNDPTVRQIANTLINTPDFIAACQDFVHSFTTYEYELGDYWGTPGETMTPHCAFCKSPDTLIDTGEIKNDKVVYRCSFCGWTGVEVYAGDCDDKGILLCSLLRTYIPADRVFCAVGTWRKNSKPEAHLWVDLISDSGESYVLEATGPPERQTFGTYEVSARFNDEHAYSTPYGIKAFGLMPLEEVIGSLAEAGAIFASAH